MSHDLRYAARSLRRSPGFTAAALVTLTLGIGATTAVFSVISGVLLRPLPYRDPDRLVMVWQEYINRGWGIVGVSHANLDAIAKQSRTIEGLSGFQQRTVSFADGDDAERLETASVTSGLFPMLGLAPATGRLFATDDDRPNAERVAVLSDALWRRRFGADGAVLGRTIVLDNEPHRIVGIMPRGSDFPPRFRITLTSISLTMPAIDVWTPLALNPDPGRVGFRDTVVIGRLAPNATLEQARAEAARLAPALLEQFPGPANTGLTLAILPLAEQVVGDVRRPLLLLLAAVALVVLIACANVASMLVARAASRRGETALRAALGASRTRLLRAAMAECLLLAGASAALGLLLAAALTDALTTAIAVSIPQFAGVTLDLRVVAFAALLATAVALIFGTVPAACTSTVERGASSSGSATGSVSSPVTSLMRRTLLACEAALALFLLVGAGLLVRSFSSLVAVDAGFQPAGRLAVGFTMSAALAPNLNERRTIYEAVVDRLGAIPGVREVGVSSSLPLTGDLGTGGLTIEGDALPPSGERPHAAQRRVDPGFFGVMGMQMARGRAFTAADRPGAPRVAIINESAARQYWPGRNPIGRRIRPDGFGDGVWLTIVGVVKDVRYAALNTAAGAEVYWPYPVTPAATLIAVIRSELPAAELSATIRREIRRLDPRLPALGITTLDDVVAESVADSRLLMVLLALFALFGLAVAASGIYGVASYVVAQRRQDVAVRLALGAPPQRVILAVMAEAVLPVLAGIAVGLAAAVGAGPLIADRLFAVSPTDPLTLIAGPIVLLTAALAACGGPARRAAGIDPVASLRAQ